jgi:hypothetical protein
LGTFALLLCLLIIPQSLLRVDGLYGYGGESSRVKTHIHIIVPVCIYMFSKCYVGFCTPRRTIMDLKKKKKREYSGWRVLHARQIMAG